jgi:hypothetical protein
VNVVLGGLHGGDGNPYPFGQNNMADDERILSYRTASRRSNRRFAFPPWLGFVAALLSLIGMQFIWMVGVFGNAHRDDIAMIVVLSLGALAAFAGFIAALGPHGHAPGTGRRQAIAALFGGLNLIAGCFLVYAIRLICGRMY